MTGTGDWQDICDGIDAFDLSGGCTAQLAIGSGGDNAYNTIFQSGFHGVWMVTEEGQANQFGDRAESIKLTCSDEDLVPLEYLGWGPFSEALTECQGDCDGDSECSGTLTCYHNASPPGCSGDAVSSVDYCYCPDCVFQTQSPTIDPTTGPTIPTSDTHWIMGGGTTGQAELEPECTYDVADQSSTINSKGNYDIAVSCCSMDGTVGYRPDCDAEPATYEKAVTLCEENGYRLCTMAELETDLLAGVGCGYGKMHNWVSDVCSMTDTHWIMGGGTTGQAELDPECTYDVADQSSTINSKGNYDIAVSCCSMDGTVGYRPDCDAEPATYEEAVTLCEDNGYRLCTMAELETNLLAKVGCGYGTMHNWVSDVCSMTGSSAKVDVLNWDEFGVDPLEPGTFGEWYQAHYYELVVALLSMAVILCGVALCYSMRQNQTKYAGVPTFVDTDTEMTEYDEEKPINK